MKSSEFEKVVIDCEHLEEARDVLRIARDMSEKNSSRFCFVGTVLLKDKLDYSDDFIEEFYYWEACGWLGKKIKSFFVLAFCLLRYRPATIFSGSPMLRHRLLAKIFNVKHVYYLRGLHPNPDVASSLSDKLFFKLGKPKKATLLNAYAGQIALVTSYVNKSFLIARGVDHNKIFVIGAPWLSPGKDRSLDSIVCERVFFITQAFSFHHHNEAQKEQYDMASNLQDLFASSGFKFVVRKHPRDFGDYEGFDVDSSDSKGFIDEVAEGDVVITPYSTLGFELVKYGARPVFYSTESMQKIYGRAYVRLGIKPYTSPCSIFMAVCESDNEDEHLNIAGKIFEDYCPSRLPNDFT